MILLVHLLFGAAIGNTIANPVLAIILAFLGHYLLDFFPHVEYSIENITKKQWRKATPDFIKVFLDIFLGLLLILLFSKPTLPAGRQAIIYVCAFFGILPDGISLLDRIKEIKFFKKHNDFHRNQLHFLKHKKISNFWRISSQVAVAIISIYFLKI